MSRPNKKKISTEGGGAVGGGLGGLSRAFEGLELTGLPAAAAESAECGATAADAESEKAPLAEKRSKLGRVVLRRERAHRGGKSVVVVDGFDPSLDDAFLAALAKKLRVACGCGGAVKERTIELQGDQPSRIREFLAAEGFRVAGIG